MLFSTKIEKYDLADRLVTSRGDFDADILSSGQEEGLRWVKGRLSEAEKDFQIALLAEKRNPELIRLLETWVTERRQELKDLRLEIIKNNDNRASVYLATMGHDVDLSQCNEDEQILRLKKGLQEASQSYGGYLGISVYGGFTKEQLEALKLYRTKYMPHIAIDLLPIERLGFKPLTSTQYDKDLGASSNRIFTNVKGSGDYLGASIVLDLSVEGGKSLAMHLGPFIVPVGIVATFRHKMEPFEAELRCDSLAGFISKARVDNKDGAVLWDNDVSKDLFDKDLGKGGCQLTIEKGDVKSAEYQALQMLEAQLEQIHIHKTQLAYAEKNMHYQKMLEDAELHQNRGNSKLSIYETYISKGWLGVIASALSYGSDFYWHTSKHNLERLSEFKFHKKIAYGKGVTQSIDRDIPPNLCLVYNLATKAYDRCTEEEQKLAKGMQQSAEEASYSEECKNAKDYHECASRRDAAGFLPNRTNVYIPDHRLRE